MFDHIYKFVRQNRLALVLITILAISMYNCFQIGGDLASICSSVYSAIDINPFRADFDTIQSVRDMKLREEELATENSIAGDLWRWQKWEGQRAETECNSFIYPDLFEEYPAD